MARFGCSSMTREKLRFTVRIDKFSMYVCKGYFVSPEFESESLDAKWSLVVYATDGADYDNYIDVRLKRNEYVSEEQTVRVRLSIVDFFGSFPLREEKEVYFKGSTEAQSVLSVTKERLFGFLGLNKLRLLPNDTLTLLCELVIYTDSVKTFNSREDFENEISVRHRDDDVNCVERFANSGVTREKFDFTRQIRYFPMYSHRGRCVSAEYRREDSKWHLVLYTCDEDFCHDFLDVRLKRSDPNGRGQFAEVKLSLVGRFDWISLCGEKQVYFQGLRDEESQILTLSKKYVSGWFGMNKLLLMPDDTLTLHCEIVTYEETVSTFEREEDFVSSIKIQDVCARRLISSWMQMCFLVLLSLVVGVGTAYYVVSYTVLPFIVDSVIPLIGNVLIFTVVVLLFTAIFIWIRTKAGKLMKAKIQNRRRKAKLDCYSRQKTVMMPYKNQEMTPYRKQSKVVYLYRGNV